MSERREEAYSASNAIKIRFYETCGHNEPKVSVKLIMSLQRVVDYYFYDIAPK